MARARWSGHWRWPRRPRPQCIGHTNNAHEFFVDITNRHQDNGPLLRQAVRNDQIVGARFRRLQRRFAGQRLYAIVFRGFVGSKHLAVGAEQKDLLLDINADPVDEGFGLGDVLQHFRTAVDGLGDEMRLIADILRHLREDDLRLQQVDQDKADHGHDDEHG
ncbi:MAG: hypothetical protein P8169_16215 [Chloroflexota bacterium]